MCLETLGRVLGNSFSITMTTRQDMDEIDLFGKKLPKKVQLLILIQESDSEFWSSAVNII